MQPLKDSNVPGSFSDVSTRLPCWNSLARMVVIIQMGNEGSIMAMPTLPNEIAPSEHDDQTNIRL